jgi:hypothetical protein
MHEIYELAFAEKNLNVRITLVQKVDLMKICWIDT